MKLKDPRHALSPPASLKENAQGQSEPCQSPLAHEVVGSAAAANLYGTFGEGPDILRVNGIVEGTQPQISATKCTEIRQR